GFKFPRHQPAAVDAPPRKRPKPASDDARPIEPPKVTPTATAPRQTETLRTFPLDREGNEFRFELPQRPLSMRDVRRIAIHLASFAIDFDPESSTEAQVFGISVPRPPE